MLFGCVLEYYKEHDALFIDPEFWTQSKMTSINISQKGHSVWKEEKPGLNRTNPKCGWLTEEGQHQHCLQLEQFVREQWLKSEATYAILPESFSQFTLDLEIWSTMWSELILNPLELIKHIDTETRNRKRTVTIPCLEYNFNFRPLIQVYCSLDAYRKHF